MKNYYFLLTFIPSVYSYLKVPFVHESKSKLGITDKEKDFVIKFNKYFVEKPVNEVYKEVKEGKIDTLYFSNDMSKMYSKKISTSKDGDLEDYAYTESNPSLSENLIEKTVLQNTPKHETQTYILKPPTNSFNPIFQTIYYTGQVFSSFIFPAIIFSYCVQLFLAYNSKGSKSSGLSTMFMNQKNYNPNQDRELMRGMNVSLESWAGSDVIFRECFEIISYLKNSTMYNNAGAQIPKGVLLEGSPGTGKTLIAKAIASEANCSFISIAASEFVELYVGMGASKVRNLFEQARENKPCILFIDEIDAVGRQRGAGVNLGNDEREQTLNQLLAEMDGFQDNENIIVLAATNRKDVLDSALLRPGRFDRVINIPLPDKESRKKIFNVHLKNKKVENIDFELIAEMTSGFSGADLKNLANEAAINAARNGNVTIYQRNIDDAVEKLVVGMIKEEDPRPKDVLKRIAIHEIGHAFMVKCFQEYFILKKVTIQATYNGAGGYTLFNEYPSISENGLYTLDLLMKRLIISMGGKAAEFAYYGNDFVSVGAIQDLKQANSLARKMIGNYGFGSELKVFFNENIEMENTPFLGRSIAAGDKYSERTKTVMDKEIMDILQISYDKAVNIIINNKDMFDEMVECLIDNKVLFDDAKLPFNHTKLKMI